LLIEIVLIIGWTNPRPHHQVFLIPTISAALKSHSQTSVSEGRQKGRLG
jgi:hypothetical protein